MEHRFPFKSLIISSLYFAATLSILVLITSSIEQNGVTGVLIRVMFAFLLTAAANLSNVGILLLLRLHNINELRKNIPKFLVLSFGAAMLLIFGVHFLGKLFPPQTPRMSIKGDIIYVYLMIQATLVNSIVLIFQGFIVFQDSHNQATIENAMLKSARSEAAYQLLLQQIHPHFLFNALNIVRALYKKQPVVAESYLHNLSNFLRASLSTDNTGLSTVAQEIDLCTNYLDMQKIRFGDAFHFSMHIADKNNPKAQLPIFALQSLIENAIKHNALTEKKPLEISMIQEGKQIIVSNNIQPKSTVADSTGNGLKNLAERYQLLGGESPVISNSKTTFEVRLTIIGI